MIRLEHLDKTFHTKAGDTHALDDVSLTIETGSIFGIIGYSGAGKSTLVRTINLLERPDSGKIYIDDEEIMSLSEKQMQKKRQKIGMIFQHFNLMKNRTVYENVAFSLRYLKVKRSEIDRKVKELLELVDLSEKAGAYPAQLSGGQQQRVAIARALANDPGILLCDEATSALDPQTTSSILQLLQKLNKQLHITIVIITHQMSVVKDICDHVAVMENGKIVEEGDSYEVFANPKQLITRKFVDTVFHNDEIDRLLGQESIRKKMEEGDRVYHLIFCGENANHSYIADIIRRFGLDISIIYGMIEIVKEQPIGSLYIQISGPGAKIDEAVGYLEKEGVRTSQITQADIEKGKELEGE